MSRMLVWLRNDLRLADNPLFHFSMPPESLLCVYVLDDAWLIPLPGLDASRIGSARLQFLWQSLIELRGELLVRIGDPVDAVAELVVEHGIDEIRVRADAGWEERQATARLAERLGNAVTLSRQDAGTLLDEATLPDWPAGAPRGFPPLDKVCGRSAAWAPDRRGDFAFAGGEAAGWSRLDHYLWESGAVARYKQTRNGLAGADFSIRLSPWLAQGCLSARQVHDGVRAWEARHGASDSSYWLVFELLWRDYFHWAARQEGAALFGGRELPAPGEGFRAWREGHTGMPLVDAAMRELAATGWLSNRARQNAASYLVHDLGGDWRLGAAWFEHCLVDHDDVASNWGNWRYLAGVGRDTRPRVLDVHDQAGRYDPDGTYAALWAPAVAAPVGEP